jgi:hypothetical protein
MTMTTTTTIKSFRLDPKSSRTAAAVVAALIITAFTALVGPISAQTLADPTRPPAAAVSVAAAASKPSTARSLAVSAAASAAPAATRPAPRLQAIRLDDEGAASAMVDGRLIRVGDSVDQRAVLAITARGLLLADTAAPARRPGAAAAANDSARANPDKPSERTANPAQRWLLLAPAVRLSGFNEPTASTTQLALGAYRSQP